MAGVTLAGIPTLDAAVAHVCARQHAGAEPHALRRLLDLRHDSPFALQTLSDICASDEQQAYRLRVAATRRSDARLVTFRDALREDGYRRVHCVALVGSLADAVDPVLRAPVRLGWWRRAVRLAALAQIVAEGSGAHVDDAFGAGLLSDLGDLLFAAYFPDLYAEAERFGPGVAHEYAAWGYTRGDVAAGVARHWRVPRAIVDAIAGRGATGGRRHAAHSLAELVERARQLDRRYLEHCGSSRRPREAFEDEPALADYLERRGDARDLHVTIEQVLEAALREPLLEPSGLVA